MSVCVYDGGIRADQRLANSKYNGSSTYPAAAEDRRPNAQYVVKPAADASPEHRAPANPLGSASVFCAAITT
jgi:hypothetical protein